MDIIYALSKQAHTTEKKYSKWELIKFSQIQIVLFQCQYSAQRSSLEA